MPSENAHLKVTLPPGLKDDLAAYAKAERRSITVMTAIAIEDFLGRKGALKNRKAGT